MLDILVSPAAFTFAAVHTTGLVCDQQSVMVDPFDGTDLAETIGVPAASTVAGLVAGLVAVPVLAALNSRGCVVVNQAGRLGVTLGSGRVVEPCGRFYAHTDSALDPPGRWVKGYKIPGMTYTMGDPVWPPRRTPIIDATIGIGTGVTITPGVAGMKWNGVDDWMTRL